MKTELLHTLLYEIHHFNEAYSQIANEHTMKYKQIISNLESSMLYRILEDKEFKDAFLKYKMPDGYCGVGWDFDNFAEVLKGLLAAANKIAEADPDPYSVFAHFCNTLFSALKEDTIMYEKIFKKT